MDVAGNVLDSWGETLTDLTHILSAIEEGNVQAAEELLPLAEHISGLSNLRLRGVMGMPPAGSSMEQNKASFRAIAAQADRLRRAGFDVDTISMGMSSDYELAIECGSNCVRIGTALFGPRPTGPG